MHKEQWDYYEEQWLNEKEKNMMAIISCVSKCPNTPWVKRWFALHWSQYVEFEAGRNSVLAAGSAEPSQSWADSSHHISLAQLGSMAWAGSSQALLSPTTKKWKVAYFCSQALPSTFLAPVLQSKNDNTLAAATAARCCPSCHPSHPHTPPCAAALCHLCHTTARWC